MDGPALLQLFPVFGDPAQGVPETPEALRSVEEAEVVAVADRGYLADELGACGVVELGDFGGRPDAVCDPYGVPPEGDERCD